MRVEIVQRGGRWIATIHSGGPHAPDEDHLAELEDKARRTTEYLFSKDGRLALKACTLALYCHLYPDASAYYSMGDAYNDLVRGRITRAKRIYAPLDVVGSSEKVVSHLFGSARSGSASAERQVRLSVWGGDHPSPSAAEPYAGLIKNSQYQEGREIIGVKLIFHPLFIRYVMRGADLKLSRLLRYLVRATLGHETLPYPFFRVATLDTQYYPTSLRPNSAAWERVRRAFLEGVAVQVGRVTEEGHT